MLILSIHSATQACKCVKCMFQTQIIWPPDPKSCMKMCLSHKNKAVGHTTFAEGPTSWAGNAISL